MQTMFIACVVEPYASWGVRGCPTPLAEGVGFRVP